MVGTRPLLYRRCSSWFCLLAVVSALKPVLLRSEVSHGVTLVEVKAFRYVSLVVVEAIDWGLGPWSSRSFAQSVS